MAQVGEVRRRCTHWWRERKLVYSRTRGTSIRACSECRRRWAADRESRSESAR